ncbi:MAG TPA: divalent-cation tolerance protein CutA [Verrucomicrobia bacterium]|nr:divalent-cation tolerance protein CutA [Verrucomicrobiota bacterium]HOB33722.1 divalent-cation tolerance protein CutA [Verrucomicrobiota bacterium]HOP98897.1 divalent-cation tolerance protein CutA [Verrucomicrobiota bacterium]HPU55798.1 divalent-cation tolerance protein CutA [Verrucomicrobiota bacterium]
MKSRPYRVVLVTAPNTKTARRLARAALEARAIACANLIPSVHSLYWWEGRIDSGNEVLLIMKTTAAQLRRLEQLVLQLHPYDTPEFIVLPIVAGNRRYLQWIASSCQVRTSRRVQT